MISFLLYKVLSKKYNENPFLIIIKDTTLFYILQFTWGLLANIFGLIFMLVLLPFAKLERCGHDIYVPLDTDWGLSLGMFIFGHKSCIQHEHGHSFQNAVFGPFFLTVVALPSVIRYWYREFIYATQGNGGLSPYDSIWFENQATKSGKEFFKEI